MWRVLKYITWTIVVVILFCSISPMLWLLFHNPETSSFIEQNKIKQHKKVLHNWQNIEKISPHFLYAVLAAEDQQFWQHYGFDFTQIKAALLQKNNERLRGASTITQQTVKNLFLWPQRSYLKKILEAWLSVWMELILPKKRILELYVNFAQMGTYVFGIGAASQYYFNIPANQLNAQQAILIAASLPTPAKSTPNKPSPELSYRAQLIQKHISTVRDISPKMPL